MYTTVTQILSLQGSCADQCGTYTNQSAEENIWTWTKCHNVELYELYSPPIYVAVIEPRGILTEELQIIFWLKNFSQTQNLKDLLVDGKITLR